MQRWDSFTTNEKIVIEGALRTAAAVYQTDANVHCTSAPRLKVEFLRMVKSCETLMEEIENS